MRVSRTVGFSLACQADALQWIANAPCTCSLVGEQRHLHCHFHHFSGTVRPRLSKVIISACISGRRTCFPDRYRHGGPILILTHHFLAQVCSLHAAGYLNHFAN